MTDNPASKSNKLRIDPERKLIHVPGQAPKELITPLVQQIGSDGVPTPHLLTESEIAERQAKNAQRMKIVLECMKADWRCTQCGRVWHGTQVRVKWDRISGSAAEYLFCPDPKCAAPCAPVAPTPVTEKVYRGEME